MAIKVDNNNVYKIGIDEVGRGPIAGPVAVGAFVFLNEKAVKHFRGVKESKQLTEKKREEWFAIIENFKKRGELDYRVVFRSNIDIDKNGIAVTIRSALRDSLAELIGLKLESEVKVLLDGGLKAPQEFIDQKTIIKGDEKVKVIALASICAKVLRDRYMHALHKKHPQYGFGKHKGYGTKGHYEAIKRYGLIGEHRRSFLRKLK